MQLLNRIFGASGKGEAVAAKGVFYGLKNRRAKKKLFNMARAAERVCAHMRARGRVCEACGRNEGMAVSEKGEKRGRRKTFSADKKSK